MAIVTNGRPTTGCSGRSAARPAAEPARWADETNMKTTLMVVIILLSSLGAGVAYADSDGYYCTGPGYLAYQFGFAAPPAGTHRLFVVRFGGASSIEAPIAFDLPQFQVHGILCTERMVRLAAYDAIYTVHLDETNRPLRYDMILWMDKQHTPAEFVGHSLNLGAWNRVADTLKTERLSLRSVAGGGQYLLEMKGTVVTSERCASTVTTRIVKTDRNGREVQELELFRGRGIRDCGGLLPPNTQMEPTRR